VLTALELARQARIAANRAYLAGLGLGPAAMHAGRVPPLAPGDQVVLAAARELASRAAAEQGRQQVSLTVGRAAGPGTTSSVELYQQAWQPCSNPRASI
jgi:hypothetical protein